MFAAPFRGSVVVARGLVTAGRLRGPRFVRLFPDVYVAADVAITPWVRALAAHVLVDPCCGVVAGFAAAELLGASCGPVDARPRWSCRVTYGHTPVCSCTAVGYSARTARRRPGAV